MLRRLRVTFIFFFAFARLSIFCEEPLPVAEDLSRDVMFSAHSGTVQVLVRLLLENFRTQLANSLRDTFLGMNDPKRPIVEDLSIDIPALKLLVESQREELLTVLDSYLHDRELSKQLLKKYEEMLKSWTVGIRGRVRIAPHISDSNLLINKPLTAQEIAEESKIAPPLQPGERSLSRVDFRGTADPVFNSQNLRFELRDELGGAAPIESLRLNLQNVSLGQPTWFYIISRFNQQFQRREVHAFLENIGVKTNTDWDSSFTSESEISRFAPRLSPVAAGRSLSVGLSEQDFRDNVAGKKEVWIYSELRPDRSWQENWVWATENNEKIIGSLAEKKRLGYWMKANVSTESRLAPFHLPEIWFGSNLNKNYTSPETVHAILDQVFKPEVAAEIEKALLNSETLKRLGREVLKDFNALVLPKIREQKVQVYVYGRQLKDGKVIAEYLDSREVFEREIRKLKTEGSLVYAAKLSVPLLIKNVDLSVEAPFSLVGKVLLNKTIPLQGEVFYVNPGRANFASLEIVGLLRTFLQNLPEIDFTDKPAILSADLKLERDEVGIKIPTTWHEHGPDLDYEKFQISLAALEGAQIQNAELLLPGVSGERIRQAHLTEDLSTLLSKVDFNKLRAIGNPTTSAGVKAIDQGIAELVKDLVDPGNPERIFRKDLRDANGNKFSADFSLQSVDFVPEMVQCELIPSGEPSPDEVTLLTWNCRIQLPKMLKIEIRNLKSTGGSISAADGIFENIKNEPLDIKMKLIKNSDGKVWIRPENFKAEQILSHYAPKVEIPKGASIQGEDFKARTAASVKKGAALVQLSPAIWTPSSAAFLTGLAAKTQSFIENEEVKSAVNGLIKGWEENKGSIARLMEENASIQLPEVSSSYPLFEPSPSDTGRSVKFIERKANERLASVLDDTVHFEDPTQFGPSPLKWYQAGALKELATGELYKLPYRIQEFVELQLFKTVQERAFDPLGDWANQVFRDLQPAVEEKVSGLLVSSGANFATPPIKSVCLVKGSPAAGVKDLTKESYSILMAAKAGAPSVVEVQSEKLPKAAIVSGPDGGFSTSLGYGYINDTLQGNKHEILRLLEDFIKFDDDPKTGNRKPRALIGKNFKIKSLEPRFEMRNGERVLVIGTRFAQPIKIFPGLDQILNPLIGFDTKDIEIIISPKHEYIELAEDIRPVSQRSKGEKVSGIVLKNQNPSHRKLDLKKGSFRSLLTSIILLVAKKKFTEGEISLPLKTKIKTDLSDFNITGVDFEENWLSVNVQPKLSKHLDETFAVSVNFPKEVGLAASKKVVQPRSEAQSSESDDDHELADFGAGRKNPEE